MTKSTFFEFSDSLESLDPNGFILPHKLNALILNNKKTLFDIFKSISETLLQFGKNNISGKLGFLQKG